MDIDKEHAKFRATGVPQVRINIAASLYRPRVEKLAIEWVEQNEPSQRRWFQTPLGIVTLAVIAIVAGAILIKALGLN